MDKDFKLKKLDLHHVVQPIVDILNNEVFGYEMLLRSEVFENPELLFKHAEKQDELFDLDMLSINKAFETINKYNAQLDKVHVFINVLPSTISNPNSLEKFQQLKSTLKSNLRNVVFELTEWKKEEELVMCNSMVGDLKKLGFIIALDDIGKGDSGLPYIIELEPNVVKLDRYFSQGLSESPKKQKVIDLMLKLVDKDAITILEGIETEADLLTAKALGIQYAQGYHLGRPKPLNEYV